MISLYACDCVRLHMHEIGCMCVGIWGRNFFLGGKNVKPRKIRNFQEKLQNNNHYYKLP